MPNILHICSAYSKSKLYRNFIGEVDSLGIQQTMYVPVRTQQEINANSIELKNGKITYSFILNPLLRLLYKRKINKIFIDIQKHLQVKEYDLIHAHFLFSNGGVAYLIQNKFKIPYIVAVRNGDLNLFFKYFIHLKSFIINVLLSAYKIVFISPAYQKELIDKHIPEQYKQSIVEKSVFIPNGADQFWIDNINKKNRKENLNTIRLLYVGEFSRNKNIERIILCTKRLNELGYNASLVAIGNYGKNVSRINTLVQKYEYITIKNRIDNLNELKNEYQMADIFIMPSKTETFGLVYVEAMSQGTPVIYSKGQGIDGYFQQGEVGYAVNPFDINEMVDCVLKIMKNYNQISLNCSERAQNFSWAKISREYEKIYRS